MIPLIKRFFSSIREYSKHIDSSVIGHAVFGLLAILCAFISCALNFSWAAFFDCLKDAFNTVMVFFVLFVSLIHLKDRFSENKDKLDYLDYWDEYSDDIYTTDNMTLFEKPLLYGLQAATFSDETEKLSLRIDYVLEHKLYQNITQTESILSAVRAMLSVFSKTERLTKSLSEADFLGKGGVKDTLSILYEKNISDPSLATWCEIMRKDKLELAYEMYAEGLPDNEKLEPLYTALTICNECNELINKLLADHPGDTNFALLYRSYTNRNIAQIHKKLYNINKKGKDLEEYRHYTAITFDYRKQLYEFFLAKRKTKTIASDYVTQEYTLALAEQYQFVDSESERNRIAAEVKDKFEQWQKRSNARTMIFNKTKEALVESNLIEVQTDENSITL